MTKRTIVIGDLHGCYDEALDLLDKCAVTREDQVIFTGDLIDRGPKRWQCVELAMKHSSVLGNHEEKHIAYRKYPKMDIKDDHYKTWHELSLRHLDYFESLPTFIRIPECNAVVVHAGVLPDIPIEQQPPNILLHGQYINPPNRKSYWPSRAPEGFSFWGNFWKGPERVIFGHTVLDKPLVTEWAVGIDTGCVFGHSLTAVILPSWEIISVPARKQHFYSRHREVARFPVMGDVLCYS